MTMVLFHLIEKIKLENFISFYSVDTKYPLKTLIIWVCVGWNGPESLSTAGVKDVGVCSPLVHIHHRCAFGAALIAP